jgi:hypothetical protein
LPEPPHVLTLEEQLVGLQQTWNENVRAGRPNPVHLHLTAQRIRDVLCTEGKSAYCPPPPPPKPRLTARHVDLDRLAYAVAVAETSNCTKGTALSKNNCHGIFECVKGKCGPKRFANTAQSHEAFKELWMRAYGDHFPTLADAKKYSGGPGDTWLNRVKIAYGRR